VNRKCKCGCSVGEVNNNRNEYNTYIAMMLRCYKPSHHNFHNYGGRGITVCDEWCKCFHEFLRYMGKKPTPKHTINRIDNNRNYEPGNVEWATTAKQNRNRRDSRNITLPSGETTHLIDLANGMGIDRTVLARKIKRMGIEAAINDPIKHYITYHRIAAQRVSSQRDGRSSETTLDASGIKNDRGADCP
jgi:hypothetical protein